MTKRKVWVLDTETKGTGAHVVPLEKKLQQRGGTGEPFWVIPRREPRLPAPPEPRQPLRFKVVDTMTERVLAEDVDARAAIDALAEVRALVDVRVYVWDRTAEDWRLLTLDEQRALWVNRPAPR
jgi:hypothetical protein